MSQTAIPLVTRPSVPPPVHSSIRRFVGCAVRALSVPCMEPQSVGQGGVLCVAPSLAWAASLQWQRKFSQTDTLGALEMCFQL